jgi:hypothetical protein
MARNRVQEGRNRKQEDSSQDYPKTGCLPLQTLGTSQTSCLSSGVSGPPEEGRTLTTAPGQPREPPVPGSAGAGQEEWGGVSWTPPKHHPSFPVLGMSPFSSH